MKGLLLLSVKASSNETDESITTHLGVGKKKGGFDLTPLPATDSVNKFRSSWASSSSQAVRGILLRKTHTSNLNNRKGRLV